jgi:hypothetical protein
MSHVERLRAQIKTAIRRGDIAQALFIAGVIVLLPREYRQ